MAKKEKSVEGFLDTLGTFLEVVEPLCKARHQGRVRRVISTGVVCSCDGLVLDLRQGCGWVRCSFLGLAPVPHTTSSTHTRSPPRLCLHHLSGQTQQPMSFTILAIAKPSPYLHAILG